MNQLLEEKYKELGISEKVYAFGEKIEQELKERFEKIDANAEYNQMKVIAAMQKNRVRAGICRLFWRGRCAGPSTDHLWNPCTCARSDVQSASGR